MIYTYKAAGKDGNVTRGIIEARTVNEAVGFLRSRDLTPISVSQQAEKKFTAFLPFGKSHSGNDLVLFTRQLSSMLTSGLTLMQALNILQEQMTKESMRELTKSIIKEVEEGKTFSAAIAEHPNFFSNIYVSLVKAGETSGFLDKVLLRLADNLEKDQKLKSTIKSALMYPVIVVIMMVAVVIVMMIFVIPQLSTLYDSLNVDLPITTLFIVGLSKFTIQYWWFVLLALIAIVVTFKKWRSTESGALLIDKVTLQIPLVGTLIQKSILAEFTRTFGLLVGAGTLVVQSLNEAADVADNRIYKTAIFEIAQRVEKGISIGDAMSVYTLFPPILVQMVKIGEQTGKLDESLLKISEYYEREVEAMVKNLTTALEPAIMVVLGIGVAFLVISIITPIYNLTSAIK